MLDDMDAMAGFHALDQVDTARVRRGVNQIYASLIQGHRIEGRGDPQIGG